MAKNTTATEATRTFKAVLGNNSGNAEGSSIKYIRPSELAEAGTTGVVAEGIYEGGIVSEFDENKLNYKIRANDGTLLVINNTGSLANQLSRVEAGTYVRVSYKGKEKIAKGRMAGKMAHAFLVEVSE